MNTEMSEALVRVDPGTPMGMLLRRFWVPVLLASEIPEPDCPPVRVKILGERLLAFRDTQGRAALVGEFCAHRGPSLYFGRNEEDGIRCSYHGWKYDLTGQCVDLPAAPQVAPKIRIAAYPCVERGSVVWAYMGPPGRRPAAPELEWCLVPERHRFVSKRLQETSYLQAMEGGIDSGHVSWAHRYEIGRDPLHRSSAAADYFTSDPNAVFEVEEAPHGLAICARRDGAPDSYYWRITQWIFPWFTLIPPVGDSPLGGHVWVPIDDENCWAWSINYRPDRPLSDEERRAMAEGKGIHVRYAPGTFRPLANRDNDYLIDRRAQKEGLSFSGVEGIAAQDFSLQESMGPIQNHAAEHLVPTDKAIAMARRILYGAARNADSRFEPAGLDAASQRVRAAAVLLDRQVSISAWCGENLFKGMEAEVWSL